MNLALPFSFSPGYPAYAATAIQRTALVAFGAVLLCGAVSLAASKGRWFAAPDEVAMDMGRVARTVPLPAIARQRCETCGVVESIRRIEPVGEIPGSYEFTVRLRDGTTRTSSSATATTWHTGDRVMLIGGAPASN